MTIYFFLSLNPCDFLWRLYVKAIMSEYDCSVEMFHVLYVDDICMQMVLDYLPPVMQATGFIST